MIKLSVIIPAVIGIVLISIKSFRIKRKPTFNEIGSLFFTGGVIYGGVTLIYYGFTGKFILTDTIVDYQLFIILGGLALLWLAYDIVKESILRK